MKTDIEEFNERLDQLIDELTLAKEARTIRLKSMLFLGATTGFVIPNLTSLANKLLEIERSKEC